MKEIEEQEKIIEKDHTKGWRLYVERGNLMEFFT